MPPNSFAFRVACYAEFGWTPQTVKQLAESEALLLSVYLEEVGRARAKQAEAGADTHGDSGGWQTDLSVGEDDEEEEDDDE